MRYILINEKVLAVCNDRKCQTLNVKSSTLFGRVALSMRVSKVAHSSDLCLLFFHLGAFQMSNLSKFAQGNVYFCWLLD